MVVHRLTLWASILLFLVTSQLIAQKENAVWYFGYGAGLDFSSGSPVSVTSSAMRAKEGCATMCDHTTGRVLFYTNGMSIWDSTNTIMLNGDGLLGDTVAHAVVIVPAPCDSLRYYVFTTSCISCEDGQHTGLPWDQNAGVNYSVVDMRANGGLGAVVRKNVNILKHSSEKMAVTMHSNTRDYWLVTQNPANSDFYTFPITCSGVGVAIPSHSDIYIEPVVQSGALKFSQDGRKLVVTNDVQSPWQYAKNPRELTQFIDIYQFNNETGVVEGRTVHIPDTGYSAGLSPDGTKLYVGSQHFLSIYQYDLAAGSSDAIRNSRVIIAANIPYWTGDFQLGPDGRLYVAKVYATALSVIENPDAAGLACNFRPNAIPLTGGNGMWGLPRQVESQYYGVNRACLPSAQFNLDQVALCAGSAVRLIDQSRGLNTSVRWESPGGTPAKVDGTTSPLVVYDRPGSYTITQIVTSDRCYDKLYDTVSRVISVLPSPTVVTGPDLYLCDDSSALLTADAQGDQLQYRWEPATGLSCTDCAQPHVEAAGTTTVYNCTVSNSVGCTATDTVVVYRGRQTNSMAIAVEAAQPGDTVLLPLVLGPVTAVGAVRRMEWTFQFDSTMVRPIQSSWGLQRMRQNSVVESWSLGVLTTHGDSLHVIAQTGGTSPLQLHQGDTLLWLPVQLFLRSSKAVELQAELLLPELRCVNITPDTVAIPLQLCGLGMRLIEVGSAPYALISIAPNPASEMIRIDLSLGLSGDTKVEFVDLQGHKALALSYPHQAAGRHTYEVDCLNLAQGNYLCRIQSGEWTYEQVLVVQR